MERSSIAAMRLSHFGKILTSFAILGAVLCLASFVYYIFILIYYLILIAILLGTVFLILIAYPEFGNLFSNTEALNELVQQFSATYIPIIAPITLVVSALAIAALAVSKQKDGTARLVISIICLVVSAVFTVIAYVGGGAVQ